jgi:hypothetical protein
MPHDALPIACSLDATELPKRLAEMSSLGQAALIDAQDDATSAELRFAAGTGVRARIDAAESQCCAFLDMTITDEPDTIVLTIEAPEDAGPVLAELVDTFRAQPQASR